MSAIKSAFAGAIILAVGIAIGAFVKIPGLQTGPIHVVLGSADPEGDKRQTERLMAEGDIGAIWLGAVKYQVDHDFWPDSLERLKGSRPTGGQYIEFRDLRPNFKYPFTDPWGQVYEYDPSKFNDNGVPFILSRGPPGKNQPITSWAPKR